MENTIIVVAQRVYVMGTSGVSFHYVLLHSMSLSSDVKSEVTCYESHVRDSHVNAKITCSGGSVTVLG